MFSTLQDFKNITLTLYNLNAIFVLRVEANNGVWRIAFAFDPKRKAILLVTGDKKGVNQSKFYKDLIRVADLRFEDHLIHLKKKK
ncbi:MAG: type II toxin-antitoxin system RelE/ParE family toxin [Saprospiraceae bacterium]|nr:type II toxin-antitoxin system RelE/ParE family toxin [Saprospiraceae bacterium]